MADIILFRCHELSEQTLYLYRKLQTELPDHQVVAVGHVKNQIEIPPKAGKILLAFYDWPMLETLPYANKLAAVDRKDTTGHNDLPVMQFYRKFPHYEHYWIIEYDVYYSGNWREIFDALKTSKAD